MTEIDRLGDDFWGLGLEKYASGSEGWANKYLRTPTGLDVVRRVSYLLYERRIRRGLPCDPNGDWRQAENLVMRGLVRQISRRSA